MTEQPVQNAAIVKFIAGVIAMLAAKYLPALGITDAQAMVVATMAFGAVVAVVSKITKGKVAPLSKMGRLAPDARAAYLDAVAKEKPPTSAMLVLLVMAAAVAGTACTPSDWAEVQTVASDVVKIAQVLCLADQAQKAQTTPRALSVAGLCQTAEQLAPYMPLALHPGMARTDGDAGAP